MEISYLAKGKGKEKARKGKKRQKAKEKRRARQRIRKEKGSYRTVAKALLAPPPKVAAGLRTVKTKVLIQ